MPISEDVKSAGNTAPESWGEANLAWRLQAGKKLWLAEEEMQAGNCEIRHYHAYTEQVFYILHGEALMELSGNEIRMKTGDSLRIPTGEKHRIRNESSGLLRFLVISSGSTALDRINLEKAE